jgi:hypothetical protein
MTDQDTAIRMVAFQQMRRLMEVRTRLTAADLKAETDSRRVLRDLRQWLNDNQNVV